jgi:PAS domain S-box-containing protein
MRTDPEEKVQLDELFELSSDAVILTGEDFHVWRVNKEFTRIFGYTAEEVAGHGKGHFARLRSDWNDDCDDGSGV